MPPPPDRVFNDIDSLKSFLCEWALDHGYAFSIRRSNKHEDGYLKRMDFTCDKGGLIPPASQPSKESTTRRVNCKFELVCYFGKRQGTWRYEVKQSEHNHPPSNRAEDHSMARRLTTDQKSTFERLNQSGLTPRDMLVAMKEAHPEFKGNKNTIYNARNAARISFLDGRKPTQALLDTLKNSNFIFKSQVDSEGQLCGLFFAHPQALQFAQSHHTVLILDSTYKTNRLGFPLLHVVAQTPFNSKISVAFCFLKSEEEHSYIWALNQLHSTFNCQATNDPDVLVTDRDLALMNAISTVFPDSTHLLCIWHINKKVQAVCKKIFPPDQGFHFGVFMEHFSA